MPKKSAPAKKTKASKSVKKSVVSQSSSVSKSAQPMSPFLITLIGILVFSLLALGAAIMKQKDYDSIRQNGKMDKMEKGYDY